MLTVIDAKTPDELHAVRQLCWDYRAFLVGLGGFDAEVVTLFYPVERYTQLMEALDVEHAAPNGSIKLAMHNGKPVGCGMSHTLSPGTAELKRVFVRDEARGLGAGRDLMQALIAQCRSDGFERILLDTSTRLLAARALYLSLGFVERGPYHNVSDEVRARLVFFELDL
jgi:GNAT superfamily N-acetyltransferase